MKSIKSTKLLLKSGRTRVYELDIVELDRDDENRFLVNYRYGWVGSELQEGTRTTDPVDKEQAIKIFDSLVVSRQHQGYHTQENTQPWHPLETPKPQPVVTNDQDARNARLIYLLQNIDTMSDEAAGRLIWRIGQVKLSQATPLLVAYAEKAELRALRVLPSALYRCGAQNPENINQALTALSQQTDEPTAQAANIVLSCLSDPQEQIALLSSRLPDTLISALDNDQAEEDENKKRQAFEQILGYFSLGIISNETGQERQDQSYQMGQVRQQALIDLFLLARHQPKFRPAILKILQEIPFKPYLFRALRRIYKAAEALDDADFFALFCQRFNSEKPYFTKPVYSNHTYVSHLQDYVEVDQSSQAKRPLAWSDRTRAYFRRRTWRHLRRLGQDHNPAYIELAIACLKQPDDSSEPERSQTRSFWHWQQDSQTYDHQQITTKFPPLSSHYTFHKILHGSGNRLKCSGGSSLIWSCGEEAEQSEQREEPFQELWDQYPVEVLGLLLEARSEQVHRFATKILNENADFIHKIASPTLALLLLKDSEAAFAFGLNIVKHKITQGKIDPHLIPTLLETDRDEAIELAQTVISTKPDLVVQDIDIAVRVLFAISKKTKEWQEKFWRQQSDQINKAQFIRHLIEKVAEHPWQDDTIAQDKQKVLLIAHIVKSNFASVISEVPLNELTALGQQPATPAQLFAVHLAAQRSDGLHIFDPKSLAQNEDEDLQAAGATLLANAPTSELRQHEDLIVAFLLSNVPASRQAALQAIDRIVEGDEATAARVLEQLLPPLYRAEEHEGVRDDLVKAFGPQIIGQIVNQGPDLTWKLLRARSEAARQVGSFALEKFTPPDFSLRKIARIGNNDQVKARQWALNALEGRIQDVQAKPQEVFSLLDGDWQDSREQAYTLIRTHLLPEHWTPEAVVTLCDSITLPAQEFGREVLSTIFTKENSEIFLTKLSEHPASGFRLVIARLIREYAARSPERIKKLSFALTTILSRVYSSRPAKEQIYAFFDAEIEHGDPEILSLLANILERLSLHAAIEDKARIIALIAQIKTKNPELIPLAHFIEPEDRSAQQAG